MEHARNNPYNSPEDRMSHGCDIRSQEQFCLPENCRGYFVHHPMYDILRYDILHLLRQASSWLTPLLFFIIVICLFPFALEPHPILLKKIAPGIIWIAALLSILLSIGNLFKCDTDNGHLDLLLLSPRSLTSLVLCKLLSHWIMYCLPLILISPLLGLLLHLSLREEMAVLITLLLGTPVLCLLGAIGAALIVGIQGSGLLLPVLIMPLYIPILIFGVGTIIAAQTLQPLGGYFAIMGALLLLTLAFAPFLISSALRMGVNQ